MMEGEEKTKPEKGSVDPVRGGRLSIDLFQLVFADVDKMTAAFIDSTVIIEGKHFIHTSYFIYTIYMYTLFDLFQSHRVS